MNHLYHAASQVQDFCQSRGWQYCFIGGLVLVRWGEPRQTQDADIVLLTQFQNEESYIAELLSHFESRMDNALEFALQNRVLLLITTTGVPIDISLGGLPFEERMIGRASFFEYLSGVSLRTASKEDMVILKAFAGRVRDWSDLEGLLIRQGDALDWDLIVSELSPLCELKESPETVTQLLRLRVSLTAE